MSRVGEGDDYDPRFPNEWAFWERRTRQVMSGKPLLAEEGEGVCAVGAFVWHKKVKAGADPEQALRDLPLLPDYDSDATATADQGKAAGLSWTLAWLLVERNDDIYDGLTPEQRYEAYLAWIDAKLAEPVPANA